MISVNEEAPVLARAEIDIDADPGTVWDIMADIENWPQWNPDVKSTALRGELKPSTQFHWITSLGEITSVLQDVERPHLLTWMGKTMGINAIHIFKIEEKDGKTIAMVEESWDGLISSSMHDRMEEMLKESLISVLKCLKKESEKDYRP
ncbi:MAG: SRPBCC family protein [Methanobacteriaceae archaeon]|nr:SRPBCC family protein [Methanobacteriaceae archaeon]